MTNNKTSGAAVTALVMGILSIILGWIPFIGWLFIILAIVFGIVGINATKKDNVSGKGLAVAGLVMGIIPLGFTILVGASYVYFSTDVSEELDQEILNNAREGIEPADFPPLVYEESNQAVNNQYSLNQDINVDYLTYKVTKVESFYEMGTSMMKKETNGEFIKVYIEILNNAKETQYLYSPRFTLTDSQDRKFDRLSDDMFYIADAIEFGQDLQPGLSVNGAIVFEVPMNPEGLKLIINGDWKSISDVEVLLDKISYVGTDTTQKDEQDAIMDEAMADAQNQMDDLMKQYS